MLLCPQGFVFNSQARIFLTSESPSMTAEHFCLLAGLFPNSFVLLLWLLVFSFKTLLVEGWFSPTAGKFFLLGTLLLLCSHDVALAEGSFPLDVSESSLDGNAPHCVTEMDSVVN